MVKRFPFPSFPSGWFAVAFSSDVTSSQVHTVRYFDQEIVLFRTESGKVHAVDPYCPHLGSHFGHGGQVVGETLRCPFHAWRFCGDGRCVDVPYARKIPPKSSLRSWPLREQDGVILVYFDVENAPVAWEPPAPDDGPWTRSLSACFRLRTHPQEIFENGADLMHFQVVHKFGGARLLRLPRIEGHTFNTFVSFTALGDNIGMPGMNNDVEVDITAYGLGYMVQHAHVPNLSLRFRHCLFPTLIDEETLDLRVTVAARPLGDEATSEFLLERFFEAIKIDLHNDFLVFEHKRHITHPVLAEGEATIAQYRRWTRQFYVDRSAAAAETEAADQAQAQTRAQAQG